MDRILASALLYHFIISVKVLYSLGAMISKQPIVYWISQCRVGYRIDSRLSLSWFLQLYPHIPTLPCVLQTSLTMAHFPTTFLILRHKTAKIRKDPPKGWAGESSWARTVLHTFPSSGWGLRSWASFCVTSRMQSSWKRCGAAVDSSTYWHQVPGQCCVVEKCWRWSPDH